MGGARQEELKWGFRAGGKVGKVSGGVSINGQQEDMNQQADLQGIGGWIEKGAGAAGSIMGGIGSIIAAAKARHARRAAQQKAQRQRRRARREAAGGAEEQLGFGSMFGSLARAAGGAAQRYGPAAIQAAPGVFNGVANIIRASRESELTAAQQDQFLGLLASMLPSLIGGLAGAR